MTTEHSEAGVFALDGEGVERLVHIYQGGEYGLGDIYENWRLGTPVEAEPGRQTGLELSLKELRTLKTMADAQSFDFEEGFIEMCLEMYRYAQGLEAGPVRFWANF